MVSARQVIASNIEGEQMYAEGVYVANATEVGSLGGGIASSGLTASTSYVELTAGLSSRKVIAIANEGSVVVYIGPSGNGTDDMYPVATGSQISLNATSGVQIYALTAASTADVRILEMS
jgi:hypothetical protein